MSEKYKEWLKQADYDMDTADVMYASGRYFYAVFMCHLSIEKALKGVYHQIFNEVPPKTHNLLYLLEKIDRKPEQRLEKFIIKLNTASVATRYPDELAKIQAAYNQNVTKDILMKSKEVLTWLKTMF
ncbi:HEPN domain-containing protein [candidate division KSB1 bacterium]|nr:HEPN domain-containing protein [candidate division KSB1 bacterium]